MATISNTPRPGYVWDSTDNVWYPIGTGPHSHADYITAGSAINPNIVDAKGDIIAATAADTVARLAVGANDTVLTADSSTATGLKWATPSAADNFQLINSGGTALSGVNTITVNISAKNSLYVRLDGMSTTGTNTFIRMRLNSDTNSNYIYSALMLAGSSTDKDYTNPTGTSIQVVRGGNDAAGIMRADILIQGANATGLKPIHLNSASWDSALNNRSYSLTGAYFGTSAISSVTIYTDGDNWDAGTIYVYGA